MDRSARLVRFCKIKKRKPTDISVGAADMKIQNFFIKKKQKGKQKSKNFRPVEFSVIAVVQNKLLALQKHVCIEIVDFMKHIPVHLFLMSVPRKSCQTILQIAQHPYLLCPVYFSVHRLVRQSKGRGGAVCD